MYAKDPDNVGVLHRMLSPGVPEVPGECAYSPVLLGVSGGVHCGRMCPNVRDRDGDKAIGEFCRSPYCNELLCHCIRNGLRNPRLCGKASGCILGNLEEFDEG